jgi:hypothetical protein
MQPNDRPEFLRILNGLAAIKPGKGLTPEALDVWWQAMGDWALANFREAAGHLARTVEFMPSPFHFEQLRKAGRETAAEAWVRVVRQSPRWRGGEQGDPDPLIDACIRAIGGNEKIAMTDVAELHWLEKRFSEAYEELRDVQEHRDAVPQIAQHTVPRLNGMVSAGDGLKRLSGGGE